LFTPPPLPPSSPPFPFHAPSPTHHYPLSLHDALPISRRSRFEGSRSSTQLPAPSRRARDHQQHVRRARPGRPRSRPSRRIGACRSEEHTSELQSRFDLVCRLLLEKKNKNKNNNTNMN